MGARVNEIASARRDAIIDSATTVFLRYGFKKTSMDDLARAAGLSRQGLYLHFKTKDELFKAAVVRLTSAERDKQRAALGRTDLDVDERLLGAFDAMHGQAVGSAWGEHMDELLETAAALVGPIVQQLEAEFVTAIAGILARSGVAAAWKRAGVSARELADHLYATSCGLKHAVKTASEYRARMRIALKIVGGAMRPPRP